MALLTQYASFFVSPFGEKSVTDELNVFLRSHRIGSAECLSPKFRSVVKKLTALYLWRRN